MIATDVWAPFHWLVFVLCLPIVAVLGVIELRPSPPASTSDVRTLRCRAGGPCRYRPRNTIAYDPPDEPP